MNLILKVILEGVYDPDCVLHALLGKPHVVQMIWSKVQNDIREYIKLPPADIDISTDAENWRGSIEESTLIRGDAHFLHYSGWVSFPEPSNININMMPFIASTKFDKTKLPHYVKPYQRMLNYALGCAHGFRKRNYRNVEGKIFFLTIQESWVDADTSQRRPGLHTDNPGPLVIKKRSSRSDVNETFSKGSGTFDYVTCSHHWGNTNVSGGIYMTSNTANSCRAWDCKIEAGQKTGEEVISSFGDVEHLRPFLPEPTTLEPNVLYWITDRTPHESLPLEKGQFRQFFRIVTSDVSLWFVDDNTENPNGVKPDPSITKIVKGSKFHPEELEIVDESNSGNS